MKIMIFLPLIVTVAKSMQNTSYWAKCINTCVLEVEYTFIFLLSISDILLKKTNVIVLIQQKQCFNDMQENSSVENCHNLFNAKGTGVTHFFLGLIILQLLYLILMTKMVILVF